MLPTLRVLLFGFGIVFLLLGTFILVPNLIPVRKNSLGYTKHKTPSNPTHIILSLTLIICGIVLAIVSITAVEITQTLLTSAYLLALLGSLIFLTDLVLWAMRIRERSNSQQASIADNLSISLFISGMLLTIPGIALTLWTPPTPKSPPNFIPIIAPDTPKYRIACIPGKDVLNIHNQPSLDEKTIIFTIQCETSGIKIVGKSVEKEGETWVPIEYEENKG
nr:hypothetical protein [Nostocaceae cyanobacterium]